MSGYSVDYASAILNHMYHIANINRNPSLPYGNLLTRIFIHFHVPVKNEEFTLSLYPPSLPTPLKPSNLQNWN